ncbi:MAG: FtsQ-type POTRA domain-containing protein [Nitrospirae bacterium]|nr:FtsQ-type POTRA domain-containing protein [Nitrospirota bacterium]
MARRSKNESGDKPESARRGTRLRRWLILPAALLLVGVAALAVYAATGGASSVFASVAPVRYILVEGNRRLAKGEVASAIDTTRDGMFTLNLGNVESDLVTRVPWIKDVRIRKEFPATLRVLVSERSPVALLDSGLSLYYVDAEGKVIEKIASGETQPFLPVVKGVTTGAVSRDVIELIEALEAKGFTGGNEPVEIQAGDPGAMSVKVDGLLVRMGVGRYEEKLDRWIDIEEQIMKQGAPIEYVDLRFAGRVVVQQAAPPEEEKTEAEKDEKKRDAKAVAKKSPETGKTVKTVKKETPKRGSKPAPKQVVSKGKKHAKAG